MYQLSISRDIMKTQIRLFKILVTILLGHSFIANSTLADNTNMKLEIIATDGDKTYSFTKINEKEYLQKEDGKYETVEFGNEMTAVETSAWVYPYTVYSGASVNIKYTVGAQQSFLEQAPEHLALPTKLTVSEDFSGRLKILGSLSNGNSRTTIFSFVLFVYPRKDQLKSEILVLYPTYTYQAYSSIFAPSLYQQERSKGLMNSVSLDRPLKITNGIHSPMRDQIVDFLQDEKLDFDVIDNDFLHENGESLLGHKLLILFGHDEYWTHEMRQAVNHFSALGGRILNMSGNLMWFKVIKKEEKIFVNKLSEKEGRDEIESWTGKYLYVDPVEKLVGVSYQYAGYPLSRKSDSFNDLVDMESVGEPLTEENYHFAKNSVRILNREHAITNGIPKEIDWISSNDALLAVEIDGAPLVAADRNFISSFKEKVLNIIGIKSVNLGMAHML